MDELNEARLELSRLEQKEKELVEDLLKIRNDTEIQRNIILSSCPANASPIRNLPGEILLRIFDFDLQNSLYIISDAHFHRMRDLAGTSRHWRALVLGCPKFWTSIQFTRRWFKSTLQIHLEKSRQCLLDITVHSLESRALDQTTFTEMLDALVSHAHRWRSFVIYGGIRRVILDRILERLENTTFSSLTRVTLLDWGVPPEDLFLDDSVTGDVNYPRFLSPGGCPRLKCLELKNFTIPEDIHFPASLTTVDFRRNFFSNPTFLQSADLSQQLTSISLFGGARSWVLSSNTIHFPLLEKLTLCGTGMGQVFAAIISPKLRHVEYAPDFFERGFGDIFAHLQSKFSNVNFFSFVFPILPARDVPNTAKLICLAFPNVLHADLRLISAIAFFEFRNGSRAVDYWDHIQTLTLHADGTSLPWRVPEHFIEWLSARLDKGLPKLHVKVIRMEQGESHHVNPFLSSHNMDNYCIVEMVAVPRPHFS